MRRGVARQRRAVVLLLVFAVVAIFFYYRKTQQMTPLSEVRGEAHGGAAAQLDNVRDAAGKQKTVQPSGASRPVSTPSRREYTLVGAREEQFSGTTVPHSSLLNAAAEDNAPRDGTGRDLTSPVKRSTFVPDHLVVEKQTAVVPAHSSALIVHENHVEKPAADSTRKTTTRAENVAKEEVVASERLLIDSAGNVAEIENSLIPDITHVATVPRSATRDTQRFIDHTHELDHAVDDNAATTLRELSEVNVQGSTAIDVHVTTVAQLHITTSSATAAAAIIKRTDHAGIIELNGSAKTTPRPFEVSTRKALFDVHKSASIAPREPTATAAAMSEHIQASSPSNEPAQVVVRQTTLRAQPFTEDAKRPNAMPVQEVRTNKTILESASAISVLSVAQSVQTPSEHKVADDPAEDTVKSVTTLREEGVPGKEENIPSTRTKPLPEVTLKPRSITPTTPDQHQSPFDAMRSHLTSGRLSTMELVHPEDVYRIGGEIVVLIQTRDQLNRPKSRGGDYLKARMISDDVAASTTGLITDHANGTYTVRFRAGWSGNAAVQVHVIHPREAVDVLRRLRNVERKRVNACSFPHDDGTEWTRCWTTPSRDPQEEECNFSHAPSGTDWYCKKPVRAPCSAIDVCSGGGLRPLEEIGVTETDKMLFNETFVDQQVMEGTTLWVQVTEQGVPCVIRHGSGNCLYATDPDVEGSDPLRRGVVLWPCRDSARQVFVLRHDGKVAHVDSGLCVGVIDDNSTDNGLVVLRDCASGGLRFRRTEGRAIQDVTTLRCLHPHLDVQVPLDGSPVRLAEGCDVVFEFMEDMSGLPKCEPGRAPSAGFYLHDNWYTYACRARQFPNRDSVMKCLTNKSVYMYGDSTVRQWFDHLNGYLGLSRLTLLPGMQNCHIGPCGSHHNSTDTHLHMMFHNFPIYGNPFKYHRMVYISEELDRLQGGPEVAVVITIWFHFLMEPIHIYRKRIVAIRDAILRLHQRQPATLVLIKSGNMAFSSLWAPTHVGNYLMADDWMSEDLDRLQREVFSTTRAVFLDVWGMTACHRAQHDIHPPSVIVAAEVRLALAYICPT